MLNWIVKNKTVYLYKMDLALNNQQILICHKTLKHKSFSKKILDIRMSAGGSNSNEGVSSHLEKHQ